MKKLYTTLVLVILIISSFAASFTETITVDEYERNYIVYTPDSYTPEADYPLLVLLHPLGYSAKDFADISYPQYISNNNNAIVVFPEALNEHNEEVKKGIELLQQRGSIPEGFSIEYVWGAGTRIKYDTIVAMAGNEYSFLLSLVLRKSKAAGYAEPNDIIDDVKFINEVITRMQLFYHVNSDIYVAGASMGGAMAYRYAFSKNNKAKKVAVVHGYVGEGTDTTQALNMPLCVFHSMADKVVPYNGGIFNGSIPNTVHSIALKNECDGSYTTTHYIDEKENGISVTLDQFECDSSKFVWFYTADNATHYDMLSSDKNVIDYIEIVEKFFFQTYTVKDKDDVKDIQNSEISLYPNPVEDVLYCKEEGTYQLINLIGQILIEGESTQNGIDLSNIPTGEYIFVLKNNNVIKRERIVKK